MQSSTTPLHRRRRILFGVGDTASFPSRLGRGLARQGCRCWVLNTSIHPYHAGAERLGDARPVALRCFQILHSWETRGTIGLLLSGTLKFVLLLAIFLWSLVAIDVVVFVSGRSLFRGYWDLWVYRLLGKRVIRVFLGSDSRPKYLADFHDDLLNPKTSRSASRKLALRVRRQQKRVSRMSDWSDFVVENPLCGHYQTKPFINWFCVGFPHDPAFFQQDESQQSADSAPDDSLKVLHCPSLPRIKGTDRIDAAIASLQADGVPVAYSRLTGLPHRVVLQHLQTCDFVIDQLYADTPMAGFASEAAAFGKASLVAGYGWEELQRTVPSEFIPPNLCINSDDFETVLPSLIQDRDRYLRAGQEALQFMNSQWHHAAVAKRFLRIIDGDIPDDWWVEPAQVAYWQGLGATQAHREQVLRSYLRHQGLAGLHVNPDNQFYQRMREWQQQESAQVTHR